MITFTGGLILGLVIGAAVVFALALYTLWSPVRELRESCRKAEARCAELEAKVPAQHNNVSAALYEVLRPCMKDVPNNHYIVASAWVCGDYSSTFTVQHMPHEPCSLDGAAWMTERTEAIKKLREICETHGDNDWPDNLNLSDVLEKHLFDHLEDKELPVMEGRIVSTKYQNSKDVPTAVLIHRLRDLSDAVAGGRESKDREFTMRIPAECDRDADLVLGEAANRLEQAEARVEMLRQAGNRVINYQSHSSEWAQAVESANSEAFLLRVQAEAVEAFVAQFPRLTPEGLAAHGDLTVARETLEREARRFRAKAEEQEKGGGDDS